MDSPEKKLQEQAAIARAVRAEQKITLVPTATDATVVDFDADSGKEVIQLSDGSIRYATPLASGVKGVGDTVLVHQSSEAYSDGLPHIKKRLDVRKRKVPQATYPFKVLFSILENGIQKFYVGGDRKEPEFIRLFELNTRIEKAVITNTGKNTNDWIIGIEYTARGISGTVNLYGKDLNDSENNWSMVKSPYQPVQFGFWIYKQPLISAANVDGQKLETSNSEVKNSGGTQSNVPEGTVFKSPQLNSDFVLTAESSPNALSSLIIPPPLDLGIMKKNALGRFIGLDVWSGLQFLTVGSQSIISRTTYTILPDFNNNYASGSNISVLYSSSWGVNSRIDTACESIDQVTGIRYATDAGSNSYSGSFTTSTGNFKNVCRYKNITSENTGNMSLYTRFAISDSIVFQQCPESRNHIENKRINYYSNDSQCYCYVLPDISVKNLSRSFNKTTNYAITKHENQKISENSASFVTEMYDYSDITLPVLISEGLTNSLVCKLYTKSTAKESSGQPREETTINEKKYFIYSQSGEGLAVDTSLLTEDFSPDASFDTFRKNKDGFKIIRVQREEILKLQSKNNKIKSVVVELKAGGNQFIAQKIEKPLEVSLLSLKAEGKNLTIHSVSYYEK